MTSQDRDAMVALHGPVESEEGKKAIAKVVFEIIEKSAMYK